jgi:hypothetical protein
MRALTLAAFVVVIAASQGSALAASGCGKGMLWPYVRQPGDCLTDDEVKAGQRGVYQGALNTNPDMSAVKVVEPPTNTVESGSSGGLFSRIMGGGGSSSPTPASIQTGGGPSGPSLNGAGFTAPAARRADDGACVKGWLWPFVRKPGECLTDAERANGQTGVYRADQVVAVAAPAAGPPGATPASANGRASTETPGSTETPQPAAAPACRKGWLWPFVRKPGDCPTDAERRR